VPYSLSLTLHLCSRQALPYTNHDPISFTKTPISLLAALPLALHSSKMAFLRSLHFSIFAFCVVTPLLIHQLRVYFAFIYLLFLLIFVIHALVFCSCAAIVIVPCCSVLVDHILWLSCYVLPGGGHFDLFYRQAVAPSSAHCCKLAPGGCFGRARRWPLFLLFFSHFHSISF